MPVAASGGLHLAVLSCPVHSTSVTRGAGVQPWGRPTAATCRPTRTAPGFPGAGGVRCGVRAHGPRLRRPAGRRRDVPPACRPSGGRRTRSSARSCRWCPSRWGSAPFRPRCSWTGGAGCARSPSWALGLEPRRGGGGSGPEFRPTPHRSRGSRRRRGRLRPRRRGAPGDDVPPCPPGDRPRCVPGSGAAGRDAGSGPRRRGRSAMGVARGVLGLRASRAGRGLLFLRVRDYPTVRLDAATGARSAAARCCGSCSGPGPGRPGTRAALSSWWSSRRSTRGCPASCIARTACRSTGRRRPPHWSSSPGSPA